MIPLPPTEFIFYGKKMSYAKKVIALLVVSILVIISSAISIEKEIKLIREFPTEEQMVTYDYVLGRGAHFDYNPDDNSIFFCSQRQHVVMKIDLHGNLIKRIGGKGQGPGEFNLPLFPYIVGDLLFVSDIGNSRIQIFTLDGNYVRQIRMIEGIISLASIKNQLYMLLLRQYEKSTNSPVVYGIYKMDGKLIRYFGEFNKKDYQTFFHDNYQTMRTIRGEIHGLQLYGTNYKIYDKEGSLVKEFQLEINPLHDPEYRKTGWLFAYTSFDVEEEKIYATHAGKGKIFINVFDNSGKVLQKYFIKQATDDVYEVSDMRIIKQEGRRLLLLLVCYPDTKFLLAEIAE